MKVHKEYMFMYLEFYVTVQCFAVNIALWSASVCEKWQLSRDATAKWCLTSKIDPDYIAREWS